MTDIERTPLPPRIQDRMDEIFDGEAADARGTTKQYTKQWGGSMPEREVSAIEGVFCFILLILPFVILSVIALMSTN